MEALDSGSVIAGRYRVIEEIGRGGMGVVYEVEHVNTGERLALKALLGTARFNPQTVARFKREARASAQIRSEHVVRVTDADTAPELAGAPFIVMELLHGENLEEHINRSGPIAPARLVEILGQIGEALTAAHELGIVHRDLKPENLFLVQRADGTTSAKVLDFGISKFTSADAPVESGPMTSTGALVGTPLYMAPEQLNGRNDQVAPSTDVWAMGLVALRLLTGEHFWGTPTMGELLTKIVVLPIGAPSTRWPDDPRMSPALDAWFARSCAREQAERWPSVGAQLRALAMTLGLEVERSGAAPALELGLAETLASDPPGQSSSAGRLLPRSNHQASTLPARSSSRRLFGIVAVVAAIGAALAGRAWLTKLGTSVTVTTQSTPSIGAVPLFMADVPDSGTSNEGARTKFRVGMRSLADGNMSKALAALDGAIAEDPGFASAYLQRAFVSFTRSAALDEGGREAFRSAVDRKGSLSPRDADLLEGMAPAFLDPPNWRASAERLEALAAAHPRDAQFFNALGIAWVKLPDYPRAEAAFVDQRTIDPHGAGADVLLAQFREERQEFDAAKEILEACIRDAPSAIGCRLQLNSLFSTLGRCEEADAVARDAAALDPSSASTMLARARSSASLDAPPEVTSDWLTRRRQLAPQSLRAALEVADSFAVLSRQGDFVAALAALDRASGISDESAESLDRVAVLRASALWETGDFRQSALGAIDHLKRASARRVSERLSGDETGTLLAYARAGGAISATEHRARRDLLLSGWRSRRRESEWRSQEGAVLVIRAFATPGTPTPAEATEGLSAVAPFGDVGVFAAGGPDPGLGVPVDTSYGAMLLAGGRLEEAERRLSIAAHACVIVPEVRALYLLGTVYAKKHQNERACEAFARVEQLWGHARPRSITAEAARGEARRLDCKPGAH